MKGKNVSNEKELSCVDCATLGCATGSGAYGKFCVTAALGEEERKALHDAYDSEATAIMRASAQTSNRANAAGLCRIEELMDFARRMGFERLGIASCSGLHAEARALARVLRAHGFQVVGASCKAGSIPKAHFECPDGCCDHGKVSCNPLFQARVLNEAHVDLNVVVGLCMGHDILFQRYAEAPCTVLVVKDRATMHNPAAPLYAESSPLPYGRLFKDDPELKNLGAKDCCS